ncbi:MAG: serine/threonine-protein kinase [Myxococcota bacterium]
MAPARRTPLGPDPLGHIGRYKLVDRLATGGMAEVFLAVDPHDDTQPLVIKRILPHLAQDDTFVRMFLQEARIALSVRHANVVRMDKLGEHGGLPFLLMEFISGFTFRELATEANRHGMTLPDEVCIDLIAQAADGATAVHETIVGEHREIVHRDLCPHNLMVDDDGIVKVLDFGIAKAAQGMDVTRTGALKGKITYLAPEQIQRSRVDRRTDLWTLSLVAWELLAGRRPLPTALPDYDLMQHIVRGELPDLGEVRPDLPERLVAVIHRSLRVDPDQRYPTAQQFKRELVTAAASAGLNPRGDTTRDFVQQLLARAAGDASQSSDASQSGDGSDALIAKDSDVNDFIPTQPNASSYEPPPANRGWWIAATIGFLVVALSLFIGGVGIGAFFLADADPPGEMVRITWAPVMPPEHMVRELEPLRKHIETELGQPVTFQVAPNYKATGTLLVEGSTDLAVLPPKLYLDLRERLGAELALVGVTEHDGSARVDGIIIVGRDVKAETASDLQGKRFCFTDPTSSTGYHLPRRWMQEHGLDPDTGLGTIHMSGNHHQVISDVADGTCDAGATFTAALRSAYDVELDVARTRQLDVTGHTPSDALCARLGKNTQTIKRVGEIMLAWKPANDAKFLGDRLHLSGFRPDEDATFEDLRRTLDPDQPSPPGPAPTGPP